MTHVLYRVYSTINRKCFTSTTEHDFVKIQQSCSQSCMCERGSVIYNLYTASIRSMRVSYGGHTVVCDTHTVVCDTNTVQHVLSY